MNRACSTNGGKEDAYRTLVGKPERNNYKNLDVDGRTILKWILEEHDGAVWSGLIWFRIGTS
jgi:hypothetical protein